MGVVYNSIGLFCMLRKRLRLSEHWNRMTCEQEKSMFKWVDFKRRIHWLIIVRVLQYLPIFNYLQHCWFLFSNNNLFINYSSCKGRATLIPCQSQGYNLQSNCGIYILCLTSKFWYLHTELRREAEGSVRERFNFLLVTNLWRVLSWGSFQIERKPWAYHLLNNNFMSPGINLKNMIIFHMTGMMEWLGNFGANFFRWPAAPAYL